MEEKKKYLLKGDISGIQEFIFNIPSDGAARVLKARSFFIQAITHLCIKRIELSFKSEQIDIISDSGGAFYIRYDIPFNDLEKIEIQINSDLLNTGLYVTLVEVSTSQNWENVYQEVEFQSELKKQRKYNQNRSAFSPQEKVPAISLDIWKQFAKNLSECNAKFNILEEKQDAFLTSNSISLFGLTLILDKEKGQPSTSFNRLPVWDLNNPYFIKSKDDEIVQQWEAELTLYKESYDSVIADGKLIDFDHLALQARLRTGTNKIGVVKMDVDNMGNFFTSVKDVQSFKSNSEKVRYFFSTKLEEIWQYQSFENKHYFKDNILLVYAGGDDCFMVGAWDAVLYFLKAIQSNFTSYVQNNFLSLQHQLTMSAGLIIVNPEYPVIRMGELAEDTLKSVKSKGKNGISLFGEIFSWGEYKYILAISNALKTLVSEKGESKALVQKIRLSAKGYNNLLNNVKRTHMLPMEKVWNLSWFILRGVKEENKVYVDQKIISKYHEALTQALSTKKYSSALVYPFSARLAEFYNR